MFLLTRVILLICILYARPGYGQDTTRQLKEITVKSRPPLVRQEIDRISYDVQGDPDHKVESALEMLGKVPLLSVDGDGTIRLNGSGKYRIFINGKPSAITTRNPKEVLKSMPAMGISKIEVITTPPARYDGEGLAGIINIVTVKQQQDGYNGSIGLNFKGYVGSGEHGSMTMKKGRFGANLSGYLYQDWKVSTRELVDRHVLTQDGLNTYHSRFGAETAELSYAIDSLWLLTGSLTYYDSHDHHSSDRITTLNGIAMETDYQRYLHSGAVDVNAGIEKGFRRHKQQLLSVGYQYHYIPEVLSTNVQYNRSVMDEHTLEINYTQPVKRLLLESGVKGIERSGHVSAKNTFRYEQQIWSVYHSWQYHARLVDVKTGARLEYAVLQRGTYFTSLLPVVSLMHAFKRASLGLSFSQRIERPSLVQLNPFTDVSNPYAYIAGNPLLRPVKLNKMELSFTTKAGFHSMLSYQFSSNDIQQVISVKDTVAVSSYANIGKVRSVRLNTGVNFPLGEKWRVIAQSDVGYQAYNNTSGWSASGFVNVAYKIDEEWRLTSTVYAATPVVTYQGRSNGSVIHVTRISRSFFHHHLSVSGSLNNPYSKYRYVVTEVNTDLLQQQSRVQRYYRTIALSASWNFGRLAGGIRKARRNIKNEDVELNQKKG